jgi:hypothetical protein
MFRTVTAAGTCNSKAAEIMRKKKKKNTQMCNFDIHLLKSGNEGEVTLTA